jgi:hypothetical protein
MMLGNQMPLKVALCAPETGSEVVLVQIIAYDLLLQALKLLAWLKKPRLSLLKRRLVNSSHSRRETNSVQPSRTRNIVVAHEQSLQLYHGRKGLWMKAICTRSVQYKR